MRVFAVALFLTAYTHPLTLQPKVASSTHSVLFANSHLVFLPDLIPDPKRRGCIYSANNFVFTGTDHPLTVTHRGNRERRRVWYASRVCGALSFGIHSCSEKERSKEWAPLSLSPCQPQAAAGREKRGEKDVNNFWQKPAPGLRQQEVVAMRPIKVQRQERRTRKDDFRGAKEMKRIPAVLSPLICFESVTGIRIQRISHSLSLFSRLQKAHITFLLATSVSSKDSPFSMWKCAPLALVTLTSGVHTDWTIHRTPVHLLANTYSTHSQIHALCESLSWRLLAHYSCRAKRLNGWCSRSQWVVEQTTTDTGWRKRGRTSFEDFSGKKGR